MQGNRQERGEGEREIGDLVFVGLNKRVIALDRYDGSIVWTWTSPRGHGFVTVLVDGDRLIVSCSGYTYCLDPMYGQLVWQQPLKGMGVGVPTLASVRGSGRESAASAQIAAQRAAAAAAAT